MSDWESEDSIAEVGIDGDDRLYVRPSAATFEHIYRAAMEVAWDGGTQRLLSPRPREWSYADWFSQILAAAANEYKVRLRLTGATVWTNVPEPVRLEIVNAAASRA